MFPFIWKPPTIFSPSGGRVDARQIAAMLRALVGSLLLWRAWCQPGSSSMHPIDFDGDGDIDIVKSSPIGLIWLENHGNDAEWETHVISLNQNIKDAVIEHKKARKFTELMEGKGAFAQDFVETFAEEEEEEEVVLSVDGSVAIGGDDDIDGDDAPTPSPKLYAELHSEL